MFIYVTWREEGRLLSMVGSMKEFGMMRKLVLYRLFSLKTNASRCSCCQRRRRRRRGRGAKIKRIFYTVY